MKEYFQNLMDTKNNLVAPAVVFGVCSRSILSFHAREYLPGS
jgi:hypothetical protein